MNPILHYSSLQIPNMLIDPESGLILGLGRPDFGEEVVRGGR